jgi:hypothetical protein
MPLLPPHRDAMGSAIRDYHLNKTAKPIRVLSSLFDEDKIPVPILFRTFDEMNQMEQTALNETKGKTLDVGAGAGCHSIVLQQRGISVTAIDISPLSVETMKQRGIKQALQEDFLTFTPEQPFDTILMLMNGTGIIGKLSQLPLLFERLNLLLAPDGQLLIDSSDLRYVFEDEDGNFDPNEFNHYYGEVDYRMVYGRIRSERFDWLYVDFVRLKHCAEAHGYHAELICEGEHYDYLARIHKL